MTLVDRVLIVALSSGAACLVFTVPSLIPIHQDVAGLMNQAWFFLSEPAFAQQYSSPMIPFEFWFYGACGWLAQLMEMSPSKLIFSVTMALALGSYWCSLKLCVDGNLAQSKVQLRVWIVGLFLVYFIIPLNVNNLYGIREHLFVLLVFPYIILVLARISGCIPTTKFAVLIGVVAAVGYCAKPFYGLVFVGIEVAYVLCVGRLFAVVRAEAVTASLLGVVYLLVWIFGYSEYFDQLQDAISNVGVFLKDTDTLILRALLYSIPVLAILVSVLFLPVSAKSLDPTLLKRTVLLSVVVVMIIVVASIQQRWYWHHYYPVAGACAVLMAAVVNVRKLLMPIVLSSFFLLIVLRPGFQAAVSNYSKVVVAQAQLGPVIAGATVGVITPHPAPYSQVVLETQALWRFPFVNMAYLATEYSQFDQPNMSIRYLSPAEMSLSGQLAHRKVVSLFVQSPPEYAIVDKTPRYPFQHVFLDQLKALRMDAEFEKAWEQYDLVDRYINGEDSLNYELYKLKGD